MTKQDEQNEPKPLEVYQREVARLDVSVNDMLKDPPKSAIDVRTRDNILQETARALAHARGVIERHRANRA